MLIICLAWKDANNLFSMKSMVLLAGRRTATTPPLTSGGCKAGRTWQPKLSGLFRLRRRLVMIIHIYIMTSFLSAVYDGDGPSEGKAIA